MVDFLSQSKNMILDQAFKYITELKRQNDELLLNGGNNEQGKDFEILFIVFSVFRPLWHSATYDTVLGYRRFFCPETLLRPCIQWVCENRVVNKFSLYSGLSLPLFFVGISLPQFLPCRHTQFLFYTLFCTFCLLNSWIVLFLLYSRWISQLGKIP